VHKFILTPHNHNLRPATDGRLKGEYTPLPMGNTPQTFRMVRELKNVSKNLLQGRRLLEDLGSHRVCSMSASIYDTAWVSMVSKSVQGLSTWLFPTSFQYICDAQNESGGWEGGDAIDEIVNSLACLLSLKRHDKVETEVSELADKIDMAKQFLTVKLSKWDTSITERVAFEIIIPSMLNLLALEGIHFQFPDADKLRQLNEAKMSKINLSLLYQFPLTVLHSLESFIGRINFDKMSHHLNCGSMMASPSSTAAYLMYVSKWDDAAERYLRDAVENGRRIEAGVVTNVFPIRTFESSWVEIIFYLLIAVNVQYSRERFGRGSRPPRKSQKNTDRVPWRRKWGNWIWYVNMLPNLTVDPSVSPDADDTAKAITALQLLGCSASFDSLIKEFEVESHFQCFPFERNPSFSANCNVLLAFLHAPDPSKYLSQIIKCVNYICCEWWNSNGPLKDKWVCPVTFAADEEFISVLPLAAGFASVDSPFVFARDHPSRCAREASTSQRYGRSLPNSRADSSTTE
jgi:hypothetical protein